MKKIIIIFVCGCIVLILGLIVLFLRERYAYKFFPGTIYLKLATPGIVLLSKGSCGNEADITAGNMYSLDHLEGVVINTEKSYSDIKDDLRLLARIKSISKLRIESIKDEFQFQDIKGMNLTEIIIPSPIRISDIEELGGFVNLETFVCFSKYVDDLTILKPLSKLKDLTISGELKSISDISDMDTLEKLVIESDKLDDLQGIENLVNVRKLILLDTALDYIALTPISKLGELRWLTCYLNKMTKFPDLKLCKKLNHLELGGINLIDISSLKNNQQLSSLRLDLPKIDTKDLMNVLPDLQKLDKLVLNNMVLEELGFLERMKKKEGNKDKLVLQEISFYNCRINDKSILNKYLFERIIFE